jgi:hypothetical protein
MRCEVKLALLYALIFVFASICSSLAIAQTTDALSSWNDGKAKQSIVAFVEKVTTPGSPDFVPAAERIATFDNDGTLWPSHPMYTQLAFALDRIKALAPQHLEWKTKQPF